ncbi:rna-directed dna polymerase from mobile element jockey- hypothetical protein [Limosa lapponica baueri]|uniref:Reverse transcriptase domain-containing protein n=1 Tax=Limosa lapponica baueri TaxID=1758121 RepID=A0A2I0U6N8_LIMLA|nr:rna-directed dna polymerase from mobile element jockey- hypothetical protein [Limosa lapponica baueri]
MIRDVEIGTNLTGKYNQCFQDSEMGTKHQRASPAASIYAIYSICDIYFICAIYAIYRGDRTVNRSWRTGGLPEDWRKMNVTPVFKKGKKEDTGNYKPFSLTSIPAMVMEQLFLDVISKHVEEKKAIGSGQHGFTKGKSCFTNQITFYDGMIDLVDEGRAVDAVYVDFWHCLP